MQIEQCVDGCQIMRPGRGRQRLLVASSHAAEIVILSRMEDVFSVKRHYDEELGKSVPCVCTGPCYTQRLDRFLACLYRAGPTVWDERVLVLPAQAWFTLHSSCLGKMLDPNDLLGLHCILRRTGSASTGRTNLDVQNRVNNPPAGFDLAAGVLNCTGISTDFFGDSDGAELPHSEPTPMKLRQDEAHPRNKPRVAKGAGLKR